MKNPACPSSSAIAFDEQSLVVLQWVLVHNKNAEVLLPLISEYPRRLKVASKLVSHHVPRGGWRKPIVPFPLNPYHGMSALDDTVRLRRTFKDQLLGYAFSRSGFQDLKRLLSLRVVRPLQYLGPSPSVLWRQPLSVLDHPSQATPACQHCDLLVERQCTENSRVLKSRQSLG